MRAIFLDKDGGLIDDVPYNIDPKRIRLSQGAGAGLRIFARLGFRLIVVSNQPGIAKGYFPESALIGVQRRIAQLLRPERVHLSGFYYCPHHLDAALARYAIYCRCRKPMPGMLLDAARDHGIDLAGSWMIGDLLHDVAAGKRAGCRTVLLDNANAREWNMSSHAQPTLVAPDLHKAAALIANIENERALAGRENAL